MSPSGVGFVYGQLRSLNRQTRLQNFAEYTRRYQQVVLNFPEDILEVLRAQRAEGLRVLRSLFRGVVSHRHDLLNAGFGEYGSRSTVAGRLSLASGLKLPVGDHQPFVGSAYHGAPKIAHHTSANGSAITLALKEHVEEVHS